MADDGQGAPSGLEVGGRTRRRVRRAPSSSARPGRRLPDARSGLRRGRVLGGWSDRSDAHGPTGSAARRASRSVPRGSVRWEPTRDQLQLLGTLVDGGVRIDDALAMLGHSAGDGPTRVGASAATSAVQAGASLGDALAQVGAPRHVVASVVSGERTGRLGESLRGAASLVGELERLQTFIRRALVYPGLVLTIGIAMTVVIATAVVPTFERTFLELGGDLPLATRLVLSLARPAGDPRLLLVPAAVLVVVAILVRRSPARRSPGSIARLLLRGVLVDLDVAVLATSMTMQLRNSVALDEALDVAADALGDASRSRAARRAAEGVRAGRGAFADDGLASMLRPAELELLSVAERTGGLADQWLRVADLRREQLDGRILRLGSTLEPLLVLLVGLLVGGIILALYLPTFRVLDLL